MFIFFVIFQFFFGEEGFFTFITGMQMRFELIEIYFWFCLLVLSCSFLWFNTVGLSNIFIWTLRYSMVMTYVTYVPLGFLI